MISYTKFLIEIIIDYSLVVRSEFTMSTCDSKVDTLLT